MSLNGQDILVCEHTLLTILHGTCFEAGDTEHIQARRNQACCRQQPLGSSVPNIVQALGGAPAISSMQAWLVLFSHGKAHMVYEPAFTQ